MNFSQRLLLNRCKLLINLKPSFCLTRHRSVVVCNNHEILKVNPTHFRKSTLLENPIKPISSFRKFCVKKDSDKPSLNDQFENVLTIPNVLTVSRVLMCPVLGYLVVQHDYPTAFMLFSVAGITDLLDGWIARTFPSQSSLAGSFLDPMADKILISTLFITLTYTNLIPVPLTALIIARDCGLLCAGFYVRYASLAPPKTIGRYFDMSLKSAQIAPTTISKYNTALQLFLAATSLAVPAFDLPCNEILPLLWYVTGTTTVISGLSYVFAKNTYRILRPSAK